MSNTVNFASRSTSISPHQFIDHAKDKGKDKVLTDSTISLNNSQRKVEIGDPGTSSRPASGKLDGAAILLSSRTMSLSVSNGLEVGSSSAKGVPADGTLRAIAAEVHTELRNLASITSRIENLDHKSAAYVACRMASDSFQIGTELLSRAPAGAEDMKVLHDEMTATIAFLDKALDRMQTFGAGNKAVGDLHGALSELSISLKAEVSGRADHIALRLQNNPMSEGAVFACKATTAQGAIKLLEAEIGKMNQAGRTQEATTLGRALDAIQSHHEELQTHGDTTPISKDDMKTLLGGHDKESVAALMDGVDFSVSGHGAILPASHPKMTEELMLTSVIETAFEQAHIGGGRDVKAELISNRRAVINERPWTTVTTDVPYRHDAKDVPTRSVIQPQSNIHRSFEDLNGGGVNCHMSKAYKHCPNVALSRVELDGKTLFQGIRHGVLSAYDLKPGKLKSVSSAEMQVMVRDLLLKRPNGETKGSILGNDAAVIVRHMDEDKGFRSMAIKMMRNAAADQRAFDVAKTALVADSKTLNRALLGETVSLSLNSVSLLTPSKVMGKGIELQMRTDQEKALRKLASQPQPVEMTVKDGNGHDQTIRVNIKTRSFNFGVNIMSSGIISHANRVAGLINGWSNSRAQNAEAMTTLIGATSDRTNGPAGDVGEWLENSDADDETKAHVRTLARQIGDLYDSGAYRKVGNDPYALTSRIVLLSSMMGETSCWNCKSGKDRTGFMDSQVKDLAIRTYLDGEVPEPDATRNETETANFFRMATGGGNHEIQTMNTGAPGYKLDVSSLADQLGGKDQLAYTKGLSFAVGS